MISEDYEWIICDHEGCDEKVKNHAWGQIEADNWVFQKNNKAWCPKHIPEWYGSWTRRKRR